MKSFVCALAACALVLGSFAAVTAGDKEKKDEAKKAEVKKQDGDKAKADKPKAAKAKKTPQDRFNALDEDGNKKVSKAEFVGKREGEKKDKAEKIFDKLDGDSSGDLTVAELTPAKKPAKEKKAGKEKKPEQKKPKQKKPAPEKKPAE